MRPTPSSDRLASRLAIRHLEGADKSEKVERSFGDGAMDVREVVKEESQRSAEKSERLRSRAMEAVREVVDKEQN